MSYTRGRFGVEFNDVKRDSGERHLLRWTLLGAGALAVVSFISARGCASKVRMPDFTPQVSDLAQTPSPPAPEKKSAEADADRPVGANGKAPDPKRQSAPSAAANMVERWLRTSDDRPAHEKTLLGKLLAAERSANVVLALDTIERLRQRPAMADLDEPLARRLGALNLQLLMSGRPTPWATNVTSRRGDTPFRIAREHGTTVAAVLKLNGLPADAKLKPGTTLRIMEFPRAALVVHRKTKQADLTLNGKFFKRYYASTSPQTPTTSVQVTRESGPRTRFSSMGIVFAPDDLDEIAMFLPPGASIVVADP